MASARWSNSTNRTVRRFARLGSRSPIVRSAIRAARSIGNPKAPVEIAGVLPQGLELPNAFAEMWVPVGEPVKVTQFSLDVLHSFYIPAMRTKRDVLPGRYQTVWFQAEKLGDYPIMCAEYCGTNHSYMLGTIHVVTRDVYDEQPWNIRPTEPVALGEWTYQGRCKACHSIDGSKGTGPTFKDLWGKTENLADGSTVLVDEAYVKESIKMPQAKIVAGYEGVNMSLFPDIAADEEQLDGIVEYLKTLSSNED